MQKHIKILNDYKEFQQNQIIVLGKEWFGCLPNTPDDLIITDAHRPYWIEAFGNDNWEILPDIPDGTEYPEWNHTTNQWDDIDLRPYYRKRQERKDGYAFYGDQFDMMYRSYKILVAQFQATQEWLKSLHTLNPNLTLPDAELHTQALDRNDGMKEHIEHCEGVKTRYPIPESIAESDNPPDDSGANP